MIYKILRVAGWREFKNTNVFNGSIADIADGFIHLSTAEQAPGTVEKHFANLNDLFILAVDPDDFGESIRWEPSRGGALFPHLYVPLTMDRVTWVEELPLRDGVHVFPERMV